MHEQNQKQSLKSNSAFRQPVIFVLTLFVIFAVLYSSGYIVMGLSCKTGRYSPFVADYLNYVEGYRRLLLNSASWLLKVFSVSNYVSQNYIQVQNGVRLRLNDACMGLAILSFLWAFCLAFPSPWRFRIMQALSGTIFFSLLNVGRVASLAVLLSNTSRFSYYHLIDQHMIANIVLYAALFWYLYRRYRDIEPTVSVQ